MEEEVKLSRSLFSSTSYQSEECTYDEENRSEPEDIKSGGDLRLVFLRHIDSETE